MLEKYCVNVLISTYNGEKYIEEQIDSVLKQTYDNIKIFIRDDGSKDGTLSILRRYQSENKIILIEGENIGYGRSFMRLLKQTKEGDFWAFCDQDDVWDEKKIQNAIEKITTLPMDKPAMYFHNFSVTNEKLEQQYIYRNQIPGYAFPMAITECLHLGFATVINKNLRKKMLRVDVDKLTTHDWWAELLVMEFGNVYVDDYIGAKHRRLDVSVSSDNLSTRLKWLIRALKGNAEISNITSLFLAEFGTEMQEKDRKILQWFVGDRYSLIKSLKKTFYFHRWRSSFSSEIVVRFLMVIGKI